MKNNAKNFDEILADLRASGLEPCVLRRPNPGHDTFQSVFADSRRLTDGSVFCAIKGQKTNGHDYLPLLFDRHILAIVEDTVEDSVEIPLNASIAVIRVTSSRAAWAQLSSFFCDHPHTKLMMIGITGTNGKTSTVWMIHELLMALGFRSASIGTLGLFSGKTKQEGSHTTPDPDVLYPFLAELVTNGYSHVTMEVSSHSLVQGKIYPIKFNIAGFTSFSQDHLDFHGTMDAYLDAKCLLFNNYLRASGSAIFHESLLSLPKVLALKEQLGSRLRVYGSGPFSDTKVTAESDIMAGQSRVQIASDHSKSIELLIPMIGDVFSDNFVCALLATSLSLNESLQDVGSKVAESHMRPVPGRLEPIRTKETPCRPIVYVDYAHTPDALEKAIGNLSGGVGRVITIFGCGGDRDKSKRPVMGAIASRLSHVVFITSDNPRSENPNDIIHDIVAGTEKAAHVHICVDREEAIRLAVNAARYRDVVLLAGKGHESYQQLGSSKHPFSDQGVAHRELSRKLRWLVLGAGQSGHAALDYLLKKRQKATLTDDRLATTTDGPAGSVPVVHPNTVKLEEFDKVVISPGVSFDHPLAVKAKSMGLEILTEIDLGLNGFTGNVLGVTGTNGKSTTVAMIDFALQSLGYHSAACGNIGIPPTTLDLERKEESFTAVLELSSYQLEGCLAFPAKAVAITSFSNDHLARHKTIAAYFEAKWKLVQWVNKNGLLVLSRDVAQMALSIKPDLLTSWPNVQTIVIDTSGKDPMELPSQVQSIKLTDSKLTFEGTEIDFTKINIQGVHNQLNATIACLLAQTIARGHSLLEIMNAVAQFKTLPYRCETVLDFGDYRVINDSKSTNLESTLAAMSMAKRPCILLMGGQGKGEPYHGLMKVKGLIKVLLTFGASGPTISSEAPTDVEKYNFPKMGDAVLRSLELAREYRCDLIFSPGCASFDEFRNFEHRGQMFNQLVAEYMNKQEINLTV